MSLIFEDVALAHATEQDDKHLYVAKCGKTELQHEVEHAEEQDFPEMACSGRKQWKNDEWYHKNGTDYPESFLPLSFHLVKLFLYDRKILD